MSLVKISRKLRRKFRVGKIALIGAEQTAKDVVGRWRELRATKLSEWTKSYETGIKEADTTLMESNLSQWYNVLKTVVAPELKRVIPEVYARAKGEYLVKKKIPVTTK